MLLLWLAGLLVAIAATGAMLAWRRHSQRSGIVALIALAGAALLLALPRIAGHLTSPERAFRQALGAPPPGLLTQLRAQADPGFGFTNLFVGFDSTPAARSWLVAQLGSAPRLPESDLAARLADGGDTPDWWHGAPAAAKRGQCLQRRAEELHGWNGWQRILLVDCNSDRRLYLLFTRTG